jgi:hypothetical protein
MNTCKTPKIITQNIRKFTKDTLNQMFELYKSTYSSANQVLWFNKADDLLKYNCGAVIICNDSNTKDITAYILFQFKPKANKISLLCHNGTQDAKEKLMNLLSSLLKTNGWILEAADAVSWVLRKKEDVPIITEQKKIINLLDLQNSKSEMIKMNLQFNKSDRTSYSYEHIFIDKDGLPAFINKETLFGTGKGCIYNNDTCDRICISTSSFGKKFTVKNRRK